MFWHLCLHNLAFLPQETGYKELFSSRAQEQQWAVECLDLLANFTVAERQNASEGDPVHVEFKMRWAGDRCFNPFRTPVPFGDKSYGIRMVFPQIGTAVLKGLISALGRPSARRA